MHAYPCAALTLGSYYWFVTMLCASFQHTVAFGGKASLGGVVSGLAGWILGPLRVKIPRSSQERSFPMFRKGRHSKAHGASVLGSVLGMCISGWISTIKPNSDRKTLVTRFQSLLPDTMFFKVSLLVVLAAWVKEIACAELQFHLYAYGTGMKPGLQLFYGDGQRFQRSCAEQKTYLGVGRAYVGMTAPTFVEHAVNITRTNIERSR